MPAASWSGLSATTICIVEQFGLATIPLRASDSASGLTSETTSGTSVVHPPLRRVVDDDRARLGEARRPLAGGRRRRRRRSRGRSPGSSRRSAAGTTPTPSSSLPAERSEANGTISRAGKPRSRSSSQHHAADLAGRADDRDAVAVAWGRARSDRALIAPAPRSAAPPGSRPRPARTRRAAPRTASATRSPRITHEILIGEVEIISMLIPSLAERGEHLRGDARVRLHPRADDRDLAHLGSSVEAADAELGDDRLERVARASAGRRAGP